VQRVLKKNSLFTAVYEKRGKWYIGYVEEIPGVNTQGKTLAETKKNLQEALELVLETNRILSRSELHSSKVIREPLIVTG
jgi:predicted RNase H-like HicB family nuclease